MNFYTPNEHDYTTRAPHRLCTPPASPKGICPFCHKPGFKASGCKFCGTAGYPGEEPPIYRRRKWNGKSQGDLLNTQKESEDIYPEEQEDLDEYMLVNPLSTEPE
jgi:hypothetical protein